MNQTPIIHIKIKTLTGKLIDYNIEKNKTIHDLKSKICETEGIPIEQQSLIFKAKQLEDNRTLSDYNVDEENENIFHLILRLKKPVILFYNYDNNTNLKLNLKLQPNIWRFDQINPKQAQLREEDEDHSYKWNFTLKNISADKNLLYDINRKRSFSYIFWEAQTYYNSNHIFSEYLHNSKKYLFLKNEVEDKLDMLLRCKGLNEVESQDLITYWLPNFFEKEYIAVTFFDKDIYNQYANLEVIPEPDMTIRMFLLFKTLTEQEYKEMKKDEIIYNSSDNTESAYQRHDIKSPLVVEWGVMKIN